MLGWRVDEGHVFRTIILQTGIFVGLLKSCCASSAALGIGLLTPPVLRGVLPEGGLGLWYHSSFSPALQLACFLLFFGLLLEGLLSSD